MRIPAFRGWRGVNFAALTAFIWLSSRLAAVELSEIHYHPPEGNDLEFIEIYNPDLSGVSLAGWRFTSGIRFTFPPGAAIPGRGYVVVARNPSALAEKFKLRSEAESIFGPYPSSLDNGGETLALVNVDGTLADAVTYDNSPPWDPGAAGKGGSLERVCESADSELPWNWSSDVDSGPSPLRPSRHAQCPPPSPPPPSIAINEIHYHPLNDADLTQEFVEVLNTTSAPIDMTGYSFDQGIHYHFPDGTVLPPHGYLVVCRNAAVAGDTFGIEGQPLGNFEGQLSNGGERITLFDARGALVDSVHYSDAGDWPVAADGLGRSLERISPASPGDDPASWAPSSTIDVNSWHLAGKTGPATSSTLYLYVTGAGEFLVDDVVLEASAQPGVNLLKNGSFDAGLDGWTITGNHLDSIWQSDGGSGGSGALHVVSNGRGTGAANGIATTVDPPLTLNQSYRLFLRYRYLTGDTGLLVRVNGSSLQKGLYIDVKTRPITTAGGPNSAASEVVPPFISHLNRVPREPRSTDPVAITARVRGTDVLGVYLDYWVNFKPDRVDELLFYDDGMHQDGAAGDGVYGVQLPPFPHNTAVTFRVLAEDSHGGRREVPAPGDPTGYLGFYVNDDQPVSTLPAYQILLQHTSTVNPLNLIRALDCTNYKSAAFAFKGELYPAVGIRQRGQSVCNSQKPYLKIRFSRGREFQDHRKIDLQSLWTDKSLIRENMAWTMFAEMSNAYCTHQFVRINANGKYYGLYADMEHPDARFLARNGLNPAGNLYKATAARDEKMTNYQAGYSKKTNQDGDYSDLKTFLDAMNTVPRTQLQAFWEKNFVEDNLIDYQAAQTLINNSDYPHKNHYLYHDTADGRWRVMTWDIDLTFGKIWDGNNGGVLNDGMNNPGNTPWYTTRVAGEGIGNYLTDRFFFDTPDKYYQRAYRVRLWLALEEKYTPQVFEKKIGALRDRLMVEQADDLKKWGRSSPTPNDPSAPKDFLPNLDRVKTHIKVRQTYLLNYLKNTDRLTPPDRLKITEVMYHPLGKNEDLEYLELYNNSGKPIDISGWRIDGIDYQFPTGSTVADAEVFVVAKSPSAFNLVYGEGIRVFGPYPGELSNDGQELRVRDAGPGYPATVDYLHYRSAAPWPTQAADLGHSIELTQVSADRDNDLPENWRASVFPGGTPGVVPGLLPSVPFRRGNCNGDDRISISDAITLLGMLLYGFPPPRCIDGCDANGDKAIDLTDAVVLLRYLFLAEDQIADPGPRDCRAVEGSFCEVSNCPAAPPP